MSASNYLEDKVMDHLMNKTAYTAATTFYVALCTTAPTDASTGSTIVEATYTGYARKSFVAGDLNASSSGTITNANAITFAACTGSSSTVTHFAICDASSAGNVLFWGALTSSLAVSNGITPSLAASALSLTAD